MCRRSAIQTADHPFNPRCQLVYRLTHGPTEVVEFLPIRSSIKGSTDIGAVQPKIDEILLIDHRILVGGERGSQIRRRRIGRKHTLIMVSTTLTEPKTAFAGVTLDISFARFIASMDTFNVETRPPRPLGRREVVAIVKSGGKCGKRRGRTLI